MEREESDLYGLPLDEFIPARTELEKRLRKEGDRERAAAVKKLPKPSAAAWGVNQASRSQPQARRELLDASAELRDVQERLIAGDAGAAELEAVAARQRAAIDTLVDAASGLLTGDGKSLGDAILARVRETFAAVAADEELAELVEAGTVDRERRPAGLGFPFAAAAPSAAPRGRGSTTAQRTKPEPEPRKESAKERKRREKEAERRERELEAAREAVKAAKAEEKESARRRKGAEREAANAAKELEWAERAVAIARERADAAREDLDAAAAAAAEASAAREAAEAEVSRLA